MFVSKCVLLYASCVPVTVILNYKSHLSDVSAKEGNWLEKPDKGEVKSLSCVLLFATPWTVAHQAPPSMRFSRQEYWSGMPFPPPGDLPDPGIEPRSPSFQGNVLTSEPPGKPKD